MSCLASECLFADFKAETHHLLKPPLGGHGELLEKRFTMGRVHGRRVDREDKLAREEGQSVPRIGCDWGKTIRGKHLMRGGGLYLEPCLRRVLGGGVHRAGVGPCMAQSRRQMQEQGTGLDRSCVWGS